MDIFFRDFQSAHLSRRGPLLATTLKPIAPAEDLTRLRRFFNSPTSFTIQGDLRSGLLAHSNTEVRFSKAEGNGWVDIYVAYWKAVGEILAIEDGIKSDWTVVYEVWREVTNALIKGYTSANFESWTIPCLYVVGKYLRVFAIKADQQAKRRQAIMFNGGMQEDVTGDSGKDEKLEDAARVINRIFTLCISDRYVIDIKHKLLQYQIFPALY